jgi:hypothetical protein
MKRKFVAGQLPEEVPISEGKKRMTIDERNYFFEQKSNY